MQICLKIVYCIKLFLDLQINSTIVVKTLTGFQNGEFSGGLAVLQAFDSDPIKTRRTHKYIIMQLVNSNDIVTCSRTAMREEAALFL